MKNKTYSLNSHTQRTRQGRVEKRKKRENKIETPLPIPPEPTPRDKTSPLRSPEQFKSLREIENIRYDIFELGKLMDKEITNNVPENSGMFKGVVTERKLWKRFVQCYARFCGNLSKSCDYCGISRNHFYRARERYPSLNLLIQLIDDRFLDTVEETMKRHALLPNSIVERFFILKNCRKNKYGDGDDKTPISIEVKFNNLQMMREGNKQEIPNGETDPRG